jgi:transposase
LKKCKSIQLITDTSFIKNINGKSILGRNKLLKNKNCNKISAIVDEFGYPLSLLIKEGNLYDSRIFIYHNKHLNKITKKHKFLLADKGYDSNKVRDLMTKFNIKSIIPVNLRNTKNNDIIQSKKLSDEESKIYKNRIKVENLFCYLKKYRRIDQRYDKKIESYYFYLY